MANESAHVRHGDAPHMSVPTANCGMKTKKKYARTRMGSIAKENERARVERQREKGQMIYDNKHSGKISRWPLTLEQQHCRANIE